MNARNLILSAAITTLLASAAITTLLASAAMAQPPMGRHGDGPGARHGGGFVLRAIDADKDHTITSSEFEDFLDKVDANSDGVVEREELHAALTGDRQAQRPNPLDQNGNGIVEVDDFRQIFSQLDADGNGEITAEEMPKRRSRQRVEGKSRQSRRGGGPGMGGPGRGPRGGAMIAFHSDADQNGEVTNAEWQGFVAGIDDDGSGEISADEWAAALPGRGDREPPPEHFERLTSHLDRNDNGILETVDLDAIFDELDADASGTLETGELPRRRHRGRRG